MELLHVIILLFTGFLVFALDKKKKRFPVPMVLVLIGICLSLLPFFSGTMASKELIHDWFLPAVLFTAAYQFDVKHLKKNKWFIIVLSTVGLIAGVFLLASSIHAIGLVSLSFGGALLIAALLMPIDSVTVISVQQKSGQDKQIEELVEGESLASDGTSIALFTAASALFFSGQAIHPFAFMGDFFLQVLGGAAIGLALGWLFSKAIHLLHDRHYQVMLSIVLAYASFYFAEHLHLASLLAVITAGLTLSYELEKSDEPLEQAYRSRLDGFWEVVEPALVALIFLLIGLEFLTFSQWQQWPTIITVFLLTLLVRFILLAAAAKAVPNWRRRFQWSELLLITVSGIKGTVAVSLLLGLAAQEAQGLEHILSIAFGTVILSIVLQSLLIYPLSKWVAAHPDPSVRRFSEE